VAVVLSGVVGILSAFGFISVFSSTIAVTSSSCEGVFIVGVSVGGIMSGFTHRIKVQLVRVRERRIREKRECFIVRKIETEQKIEKGIICSKIYNIQTLTIHVFSILCEKKKAKNFATHKFFL